jgi:dynein heavy chain 1
LLSFLTKFFNPIDDALQKLAIFEGKYVRLKDERDNVAKAKEALELQDVSVNLVSVNKTSLLILKTVKLNYLQSRVSLF